MTNNERLECEKIAESTARTFTTVLSAGLTEEQRLVTAKFLLGHIRVLVGKLEAKIFVG